MRALTLLLAVASALLVAYGAALVYLPAGFIVGGLECAGFAYMAMEYMKVRELAKARRE